ncbi:MAG: amidohydrolase, partial [Actinobacteria bacterium]|nr:amidohydrolase [Actinomycetota bacterium]
HGSLEHLAGPGTVRRDLDGAFLMPGLVDVHNHHAVAGKAELYELQLPIGSGLDEVLQTISQQAAQTAEGGWITGGPLGTDLLAGLSSLDALARLDEAAGGRPVVLIEDSRHNRWASTAALRLAGILDGPHLADEGVLRDAATGRPTGVLLEGAGLLVEHALNEAGGFTAAQHRAASARGVEILNSFGITAFQDAAASLEMLRALHDLDSDGQLSAWVVTSLTMNDEIFGFSPIGQELVALAEPFRSAHHRPDFVKIFLDGVPPARTAAFLAPYLPDDEHGHDFAGSLLIPHDELGELMLRIAGQGLGVKVHCAGDASARAVLDAAQRLRESGDTATRVHIAHGQILAESDLPRLAELDVTADMSPFVWFPGVIPQALAAVLPQPTASRIQPNRTLTDLGARLAMGSDWPVSPTPNPWFGIHGLVTRADPFRNFPGTLWPEQALTLTEALRVCTSQGAEAIGLGDTVGRIAPGYSADFAILGANPFAGDPLALADTVVDETWFEGRRVYSRRG